MKKHLLAVMVLTLVSIAFADPSAYLTEQSVQDYEPNKSLSSYSFIGWVDVSVNNPYDVMQFIRINLSGTANTNLVSPVTYRSVASSPFIYDRTRLYHNTTASDMDINYLITNSALLTNNITLGLSWSNTAGGVDLNSTGNTILFNITLKPTQNVNTTLHYQTFLDCYGTNDCMNITSVSSGSITDSDTDGFNDGFETNLSLTAGVESSITFNATIKPNVNYYESLLFSDTGPIDSVSAGFNASNTFTGIGLNDLFSRGPVTQGIDIAITNSTIFARCFIENDAVNISYKIHSWELINLTDNSTIDQGSPETIIGPGGSYYTHNINVSSSNKSYYSCAFDWEVIWESNTTSSSTLSRINGPLLYELNVWANKLVTMVFSNETGRKVQVNDTVRHLGHSTLGVNKTEIVSIIPHLSDNGVSTPWAVSDIKVTYKNSTGYYDITGSAVITVTNATLSADGEVKSVINDLNSVIGRSLAQNEDIILSFSALAPANESIDSFSFTGNTTMWTDSGTPDAEVFQAPGVGVYYCPPCPTPPECPACPPAVNITEHRTKSLYIDAPWIIEAVLPSDSFNISFKNVGDSSLKGLSLLLTSRFSTVVDYNPGIGDLNPGEERVITVTLSNLTRSYDFVFINVTDHVDYWTSAFVVYVPEIISPPLGFLDCIEFTPNEFRLMECVNLSALHCNAYDETCGSAIITINARNTCEPSLLNVGLRIEPLGYYEFINTINNDYNITVDIGSLSEFVISAVYDSGFSSQNISVLRVNPVTYTLSSVFSYEVLWIIIFGLAIIIITLVSTAYFVERKRGRKKS